jgi:hypothetical protein
MLYVFFWIEDFFLIPVIVEKKENINRLTLMYMPSNKGFDI